METVTKKPLVGTHVVAFETDGGIVIPEFYREGLINKERIINAYRNFAPIYDLTLKRTYQVVFSGVKSELMGLPKEIEYGEESCVADLAFDKGLGVREVFEALGKDKRAWFVNEFYQLLCLGKGLYPCKNYGEKNDACHPYMLFLTTEFTRPLCFEYDSIDEYVRAYYAMKKPSRKLEKQFKNRSMLNYVIFKAQKQPKQRSTLFRTMYCGEKKGQAVLNAYYHKKTSARKKLMRKLDAMMMRRVNKYGLITD